MACIEPNNKEDAGKCRKLQVTARAPSVHEVTGNQEDNWAARSVSNSYPGKR